jgi:hypothetical protein
MTRQRHVSPYFFDAWPSFQRVSLQLSHFPMLAASKAPVTTLRAVLSHRWVALHNMLHLGLQRGTVIQTANKEIP